MDGLERNFHMAWFWKEMVLKKVAMYKIEMVLKEVAMYKIVNNFGKNGWIWLKL